MSESIGATPPSTVPVNSLRALTAAIRDDRRAHDNRWSAPGFQALVAVRVGNYALGLKPVPRKFAAGVYRFLRRRTRLRFGIEIFATTTVGRNVRIAHHGTIVIHPRAVLGDRCLIRQGVTIGGLNDESFRRAPTIGADVEVGAGAMIVGDVVIGDRARIGPNAVVTTSVPEGAIVSSPRPRIMLMP
ncbi:serine O-acetyltransferase [Ilumatobacter nonamiensis]|uniref:serine O-acetyltransferase n=1 Tax=Ilumatobacter nonamiensis TaxID=467093 RepID=UPI00034D3934|nr:serine acetyltransferase [Ilumatobacter nonamiensis]